METIRVVTGVERRCRYYPLEKKVFVEEGLQPGSSLSAVARKHCIAPSLLFNWRRRMKEGQLTAIQSDDDVGTGCGTHRGSILTNRYARYNRVKKLSTLRVGHRWSHARRQLYERLGS